MILMNKVIAKLKLTVLMLIAMSTAVYAQGPVQTYFGYVRTALFEISNSLRYMGTSLKIGLVATAVFLAVILYLRNRGTASNHVRKARKLHEKAIALHERGKEEEASEFYQKASVHREKAEAQQ